MSDEFWREASAFDEPTDDMHAQWEAYMKLGQRLSMANSLLALGLVTGALSNLFSSISVWWGPWFWVGIASYLCMAACVVCLLTGIGMRLWITYGEDDDGS